MVRLLSKELYFFRSRVLTHVLFWLSYYMLLGVIGTNEGDLFRSFELQFVSMPVRIGLGYLTIYFLIPRFLLKERYLFFLLGYVGIITFSVIGQRLACFYFHECFFMEDEKLLVPALFQEAFIDLFLITLLLAAIKLFKVWRTEKMSRAGLKETPLKIKADKRYYRVLPSSILYVEGLGNYVTFYLESDKSLIAYMSLKEAEQLLPSPFRRIHKSFVINQDKINSFSHENVEIKGRVIPIGKSYEL